VSITAVVTAAIAASATKIGADLVGRAVGGLFGPKGEELAKGVVTSVAEKLGVPAEDIPSVPAPKLDDAVAEVEMDMPEKIQLWSQGLTGQFALLQAETAEGPWQSGWRWGWMYLLALFWIFYILIFPVLAALGIVVNGVDVAVLLTLTTWFISLYMGGHTIKTLGESAIDAVRTWKAKS